jgi:hypothetical protein
MRQQVPVTQEQTQQRFQCDVIGIHLPEGKAIPCPYSVVRPAPRVTCIPGGTLRYRAQ